MNSILFGENKKANQQAETMANMVRQMPVPAFLSSSEGDVFSVSPALLEFIGLSPSDGIEFNKLHQFESLFGTALFPDCLPVYEEQNRYIPIIFSDLQGNLKNGRLKVDHYDIYGRNVWSYIFLDDTFLTQIEDRLVKKENELSIFMQVASSLGSKLSVDEILRTILIAVTAREGLGFNRACLFFYNEKEKCIRGHLAIGPSSPEEAGQIWDSLPDEGKSLREILRQYIDNSSTYENSFDKKVRGLTIPFNQSKFLFKKVVLERKSMIIKDKKRICDRNCDLYSLIGMNEFAAVPMIAGEKVLGIITADNHITRRKISMHSLAQLQIFANQAAIAVERASLYESLSSNLRELEVANLDLRDAQAELLKIERVSLWSELTNDIAHELRNPSSIIGGFAALMLKSPEIPDSIREQADIIYNECIRLDKAIEDVLDFSKSFSQDSGEFNLMDVVREVLKIFEANSTKNVYRIITDKSDLNTLVNGRRDQVKYAVYTLIYLLEERLKGDCVINLEFDSADNNLRLIFEITGCDSEITGVLHDFSNPRVGSQGLKLSMAFEAIRYNGGRLGIESKSDGSPEIYLECPLARSKDA